MGKDVNQYEEMIRKGKFVLDDVQQITAEMIKTGNEAENMLGNLIKTMSQTQRAFLNSGDYNSVGKYSQNMADTAFIQERVGNILEELLIAERNSDMQEFRKHAINCRALQPTSRKFCRILLVRNAATCLTKP